VRVEQDPLGLGGRILKFFGADKDVLARPILESAFDSDGEKAGFQFGYFENYVNRYLAFAAKSFNKSPYVSLERGLTPALSQQIQKLKAEAGTQGWYFLESIVQFNFEDPNTLLPPFVLRSAEQMDSLAQKMASLEAPIERTFALVVLYQVAKSWTEQDVELLKTDLTLIEKLRLKSAQQSYLHNKDTAPQKKQ
jgi:hypothetical protein